MATYSVRWKASAIKELRRLDRQLVRRVVDAVEALASDPFPAGTRKMQDGEYAYRIRVGPYRVVYTVLTEALVVEVIRVRHRRDAYRG